MNIFQPCMNAVVEFFRLRNYERKKKKGGNIILNIFKPCMNAVVEEEVARHEKDHEEDVPKSNCHHEDVAPLKGMTNMILQ